MKVFSINTELDKVTGVQKVLMDIHRAISSDYDAKIVGTLNYSDVNPLHNIMRNEYIKWRNPFIFYNSIVFVHERKLLLIFKLLNIFLFQRIKLIYIHHNIFSSHRYTTILPKTIVSISDKVTDNLVNYFKAPLNHIYKIYNCVQDIHPNKHKSINNTINIIYPARINSVKRQIDVYNHLNGKISKDINILFVGIGPEFEKLKKTISNNHQFKVLGFREDILDLIQNSDYVLLFSKHEGLPITLIEATMCGTPIICNDVGGNCEIAYNNENAFVVNEWEELIETLNMLSTVEEETYKKMSKKSRQIYEENFTFEKFKENYLKLLKKISNES